MTPLNYLKMQSIEDDFDDFCGVPAENKDTFSLEGVETPEDVSTGFAVIFEDSVADR